MRSLEDILYRSGVLVNSHAEDGGNGCIYNLDPKKPQEVAFVVWSTGAGWDHVSVSFKDRCPTWDEMSKVKDMFFHPYESVIQIHPKKSDYVNYHPYCLHLWKCQDQEIPMPPAWMVGPKEGQTIKQVMEEAYKDLGI